MRPIAFVFIAAIPLGCAARAPEGDDARPAGSAAPQATHATMENAAASPALSVAKLWSDVKPGDPPRAPFRPQGMLPFTAPGARRPQ